MVFWISIFLISFLLTWLYRRFALHKSLLDIPNIRSSHIIPTPKGGGIAIAITWFGGLSYMVLQKKLELHLYYSFLAGIPLVIIGFIDDIVNLKPFFRFTIHVIVAALGLYFLGGLQNCRLPIVNCQLFIPIVVLAIIWLINLFNFLDGIDGYIGSEMVFIGLSAFIITGDKIGLLLALSVSGFLIWNWQKAKIFMGDVGSTLMGYIVAILAIYFHNVQQISIVVWVILTSVFWVDATVTIIRRFLNKENIFEAHCKHAFQRIVQGGFSHQKTVVYSLFLNLIGGILAFCAHRYPTFEYLFLLFDLLLLTLILLKIEKVKPFKK